MTISISNARNDYTGNGSSDTFSYTFQIFVNTDLLITQRDTLGVESTLLLTTDYTVTGAGDTNGGTITLVAGNLTTDFILTIRRVRPITQGTDIRNQGDFFPEVHEDSFDHGIMIDQAQQDEIDRSVKVPESVNPVTEFNPTLPADLPGTVSVSPVTNVDGDGWALAAAWPSAADIAAAEGFSESAAASAAAAATSVGTNMPYGLNNVAVTASVATSALTVDLKQADASSDPTSTAGEEAFIYFRSSTVTSGAYIQRTITAAITLVVPSGATLGHDNALDDYIYIYALDNSGTVELALSSSWHWDEGQLITTTAIGATADDASVIYSATGRTDVPIRMIGRMLSNQTTAGTWGSVPTRIEPRNFFKLQANIFSRAANINAKHGIIYLLSTASARNIQLPPPVLGYTFWVKDSTNQASSNNITLVRDGSEDIEAATASFIYSTSFGSFQVICDGTDWFVTDYVFEIPTDVNAVTNLGLETTVAASALTIDLKQLDGTTDASTALPISISFRSSTLTSGAILLRQVSAALTLVVPNGATLGTTNAVEADLFVYAIDNSGTVELAISNKEFNTEGVITTTLIDATADSATVIYSASARTNVPFRLIGKLLATEATAGVWLTAPSTVTVGSDFDTPVSITQFRPTAAGGTNAISGFGSLDDVAVSVHHSVGTPVTIANDREFTFPFAGIWNFHCELATLSQSTTDANYMCRIRNETTTTTLEVGQEMRMHAANSANIAHSSSINMLFEITTITDEIRIEFATQFTPTTLSATASVGGETGFQFFYIFEYIGR